MERDENLNPKPVTPPKPKRPKVLVKFSFNNLDFRGLCTIGKGWDDTTAKVEYDGKLIEVNGSSEQGKVLISHIITYPQCIIDNLSNGESKKLNKSVIDAFYNALNAQK